MREGNKNGKPAQRRSTPGIVLHMRLEEPPRPRVTAFIWGGKTRPVPALPFGRRSG